MGMTRSEIIECLCDIKTDAVYQLLSEEKEAIDYAISSLKTDEAYQLEYEGRDVVEVIRCKDCKYFEHDHFEDVCGMSLIVAHEICTRIAGGVKTKEDGYCFLAEVKNGTMGTDSSALQHSSD